MDLILWRHAEAEANPDPNGDLQRALTPKGERQAKRMGRWLAETLAPATRVLVSPALRTQQTARGLGREFETHDALAPAAAADTLIAATGWPQADHPVLVVGHQPTLGLVASQLMARVPLPWSIKKGAVWWLRARLRDGRPETTLILVRGPDDTW